MRRYWFSIVLPVFIAASIGTYYVGAATRNLPEYQLQTVAGDANEAKYLVLEGQTAFSAEALYETLKIDLDGTEYDRKKSMITGMKEDRNRRNADLSRLMKEHSSFMRGKGNYNGFYAGEDNLVYAQANMASRRSDSDTGLYKYQIAISTLDLKTGKKKHFDAILPGQQMYSSMYVNDVQEAGDDIQILVQLSKDRLTSGSMLSEYHLYTVDPVKEGITDDRTITTDVIKEAGKLDRYFNLSSNMNVASPSNYALFGHSAVKIVKDEHGNTSEKQISNDYSVLDYATGALTPVALDSQALSDSAEPFLSGGKVVALSKKGDQAHVLLLDLAKGESSQFDFPLSGVGSDLSSVQRFVSGDRLYMRNAAGGLLIVDLSGGKVVYQGKITVDGSTKQQKESMDKLQIYNFYLTR
ncbi:hypothetical protein GZH47_05575 [Paenibacillus rhizovicinus]|uniref:Uncharacterized protein n=1 Tax=Paenibacillus rhizovicinus TaxID=2704463 RepID=A0A6C0NVX4_9BACL|nr:hypothetical protein [Paenibacillus rhizovicinus]QHW30364.1 hypothetical protein GZH47_05575 [Paenibacillus rhizovicinus]